MCYRATRLHHVSRGCGWGVLLQWVLLAVLRGGVRVRDQGHQQGAVRDIQGEGHLRRLGQRGGAHSLYGLHGTAQTSTCHEERFKAKGTSKD